MNPLLTMLGSGFSAKKILDFLIKKSPDLETKITKALATGLSAERIVSFFSKDKNFDKLKASMEKQYSMNFNANPMVQGESVRGQNLGTDLGSQVQRSVGPALGTAALTGGAYALSRAIPSILQKEPSSSLPALQAGTQQETPPIQSMSSQPPLSPAQAQGVPTNIPQGTNQAQPEENTIDKIKSMPDVLWNHLVSNSKNKIDPNTDAFLKIAQKMRTTGEISSKEDFDKLYSLFEQKKSSGMSLPKALKEASNEYDKMKMTEEIPETELDINKVALPDESAVDVQKRLKIDYADASKLTQERDNGYKPIAKSEMVASPHGVGEVKEIRGDKALIDVDGKLHKVNVDELETSPLPEKDLADLYNDLKSGIEDATDEEMSRMVDYAGYDPNKNTLAFLPYTGALYVYDNISPEDASLLRNVLNVRKSSGENFIGVWKKDSKSPIGSAMSALIKRLQSERGGKGKEYSHKFETVYKSQEPAILAAKKKKAEEERRKKKNAKT